MDIKTYRKTFNLICDECEAFMRSESEYCEKCGSINLRKATKEDYQKHLGKKIKKAKETRRKDRWEKFRDYSKDLEKTSVKFQSYLAIIILIIIAIAIILFFLIVMWLF